MGLLNHLLASLFHTLAHVVETQQNAESCNWGPLPLPASLFPLEVAHLEVELCLMLLMLLHP